MQAEPLTYSRLIRHFKTLGPYIREEQCNEQTYFFDCFAVCVNAKIDPSRREFWGWWMTLDHKENTFTYSYQLGLFDTQGQWKSTDVPQKKSEEVNRTLNAFYERLDALLKELKYDLTPSDNLDKDKVLHAA